MWLLSEYGIKKNFNKTIDLANSQTRMTIGETIMLTCYALKNWNAISLAVAFAVNVDICSIAFVMYL